jgi:hypothetical protein
MCLRLKELARQPLLPERAGREKDSSVGLMFSLPELAAYWHSITLRYNVHSLREQLEPTNIYKLHRGERSNDLKRLPTASCRQRQTSAFAVGGYSLDCLGTGRWNFRRHRLRGWHNNFRL